MYVLLCHSLTRDEFEFYYSQIRQLNVYWLPKRGALLPCQRAKSSDDTKMKSTEQLKLFLDLKDIVARAN